jgi:hypothetical protein
MDWRVVQQIYCVLLLLLLLLLYWLELYLLVMLPSHTMVMHHGIYTQEANTGPHAQSAAGMLWSHLHFLHDCRQHTRAPTACCCHQQECAGTHKLQGTGCCWSLLLLLLLTWILLLLLLPLLLLLLRTKSLLLLHVLLVLMQVQVLQRKAHGLSSCLESCLLLLPLLPLSLLLLLCVLQGMRSSCRWLQHPPDQLQALQATSSSCSLCDGCQRICAIPHRGAALHQLPQQQLEALH